jgi:hypothetical protein
MRLMSLASRSGPRLGAPLSGALLVLLGAAAACETPTGPVVEMPARAVVSAPAAQYGFWWSLVETCSDRRGSIGSVQWYVWPEPGPLLLGGKWYNGYWWQEGNRILLAKESVNDGRVVRHEMLHQLLQQEGHPTEYFDGRCEGVVDGTGAGSAALADPSLVARAREVGPEVLAISVAPLPARPRASANDGWLALDVQATNPTTDPVWVRLEPFFDGYLGFGVVFPDGGRSAAFEVRKEERMFFAPGQRRHWLFDLREAAPVALRVRGRLAAGSSSPYIITIDP